VISLLRKLLRIPLLLFWFIGVSAVCRLVNHGRGAPRRALGWTFVWARVTASLFNLKIRFEGTMPREEGGLLVANHQSCLDILVLAASFRIRFAPKIEMRSWPVIGFLTKCNFPVWIDRSTPGKAKGSSEAMGRTMRSGNWMMVFPEGTVSDGKAGLLPFKSTPFQAVIDSGSRVLPLLLVYDEKCRSQAQWPENSGFLSHVWQLLGLKETHVTVYIMQSATPGPGEDRKKFAVRMHDMMEEKWRCL